MDFTPLTGDWWNENAICSGLPCALQSHTRFSQRLSTIRHHGALTALNWSALNSHPLPSYHICYLQVGRFRILIGFKGYDGDQLFRCLRALMMGQACSMPVRPFLITLGKSVHRQISSRLSRRVLSERLCFRLASVLSTFGKQTAWALLQVLGHPI